MISNTLNEEMSTTKTMFIINDEMKHMYTTCSILLKVRDLDVSQNFQNTFLVAMGCSRKNGIEGGGVGELKSIKIRWVGGVSWNIHMNCTIKKDKIVLVVPPFSSSVPPPPTPFFLEQPLQII